MFICSENSVIKQQFVLILVLSTVQKIETKKDETEDKSVIGRIARRK